MHILHINLAKGFRGGERQTGLLIDGLAKQYPNVKQSLLVRRGSPLPDFLKYKKNVAIIEVNKPFMAHSLKASKDYSLIHAHDAKACHLAYALHTFSNKTPYIITRRMDRTPKKDWFTKKVYNNTTLVVCLSNAIGDIIKEYNAAIDTRIIPSMLASLPSSQNTIQGIRKLYKGKILVGNIGALVCKHKGQQFIIEAAKQLEKSHPQFHFLLIGQGQDEQLLRTQAEGLSNVEFTGFKSNVGDYLGALDIFLFPSLEEGLGSTLIDAMDAQLPIIASKAGGIPDLIEHDVTGLLVEPKDTQGIINSLLCLTQDEDLAHRLAKTGKERSTHYTPDIISQRYMAVYQSILGD